MTFQKTFFASLRRVCASAGWLVRPSSLLLFLSGILASSSHAWSAPVPEQPYVFRSVRIGGGGFVTGLVFHPTEKDLCYARTDVGGAYRWDGATRSWICLTDWIGAADWNLTGIESIAVDPSDPERVYLAAGTYSNPRVGSGAILRSSDRGRTFARADMPFKMGGNEAGRGNGERLAVDPRDGRVLFFGSRSAGLWRSGDRGETWSRVEKFPAVATAPSASWGNAQYTQAVGIVFVVFDPRDDAGDAPGKPTRTLYAGVSTREASLFVSHDAGATWSDVPGAPVGLRPNHMVRSSDGKFYLSYGDDPGPNTMEDGAVWRFDPRAAGAEKQWTDITPVRPPGKPHPAREGFGYGAVSVDSSNPSVLVATTFCRWKDGDGVFRSTDGGKTWKPVFPSSDWDYSSAPWTQHTRPHWLADVEIDPRNPDRVLFVTGYGLWASTNLTRFDSGERVQWRFDDAGLEETVPLDLTSPPEGAHLLSALGDIDGFRHDDLTTAQLQFTPPPRFANSESIAYAARKPNLIVRSGTIRNRTNETRAAISEDGGTTWKTLASEPPDSMGAGPIALSADGATIVWTPRRSLPHVTRDRGATWTACAGLVAGLRVAPDGVDVQKWYALDPQAGKIFVSTDGAATFTELAPRFPVVEGFPWDRGGNVQCAPGHAGDLWVALRTAGLFHSKDGGATFEKIPGISETYSLGFGRAAPGATFPAIYMAAKFGGLQALFRSDDSGTTWTRINDDAHQFGSVAHVTGDPRLYGRVYFATGGRGIFYGDPR